MESIKKATFHVEKNKEKKAGEEKRKKKFNSL